MKNTYKTFALATAMTFVAAPLWGEEKAPLIESKGAEPLMTKGVSVAAQASTTEDVPTHEPPSSYAPPSAMKQADDTQLVEMVVVDLGCYVNGVQFSKNSAELDEAARQHLAKMAGCIQANPGWEFWVIGQASPAGPSDFNWVLGFERAQSVKSYLSSLGVDEQRLIAISAGEQDDPGDRRVTIEATFPGRIERGTEGGA